MTVVPAADSGASILICDGCGTSITTRLGRLRDDEVVWPLIHAHGWSGSAFSRGPHRCPRCALASDRAATGVASGPETRRTGAWDADVETGSATVVISPRADLTDVVAAPLRAVLSEAISSRRHVLLDMRRVNVIDPAVLGVLVRAHADAKRAGRILCLVAPSRFVVTALHTMRLHRVFSTFANRRQALSGLANTCTHPHAADRLDSTPRHAAGAPAG